MWLPKENRNTIIRNELSKWMLKLGVAMFDTSREPDMNPTQNIKVRVDCKYV